MLIAARDEIKYIWRRCYVTVGSGAPSTFGKKAISTMKVFVTGATGFLGAHTTLELLQAGHEVRLLVRNEQAARDYFSRHGYQALDLLVADMLDRERIAAGLDGCDAVIHAAARVSLDQKHGDEVYRTNIGGMESVIGAAIDAGIGNIVYVSSITALFLPGAALIDESSPLCEFRSAYARSKTDCERWVRARQASGAPIRVSCPSGVIGPHDPGLSESNKALASFLRSSMLRTSSGSMWVDVRDVARMHRWLLETPRAADSESQRYLVGGHFSSWADFHALLQELTGRQIRAPNVPGVVLRAAGHLLDAVRHVRPVAIPITAESMAIMTQCSPASSDKILRASGLEFRPLAETLRDTLRWMVAAGHLRERHIGALAATGGA